MQICENEHDQIVYPADLSGCPLCKTTEALTHLFKAFVEVCTTSEGTFTEAQVEAVKKTKAVLHF